MSSTGKGRVLGTLGSVEGVGVVRMQDRFDTDVADAWSAVTEPARLARWLGEVEGDLRVGGTYRYHFTASGAEGSGRIEECEPPRRFLVRHAVERDGVRMIEVTLVPDGEGTLLVVEERGMPRTQLADYGAGIQIHVEDLGAHLAGREPEGDVETRWTELADLYRPDAEQVD